MSEYAIGFGKPPKHTRFKQGKSGNPKGRPKGTRNLRADLEEELKERISFRENGVEQRHSKQRVLLKSLVAKAMKGDVRATGMVLNMTMRLLDDGSSPSPETPLSTEEEAILDDLEARIIQRHEEKKESHNE